MALLSSIASGFAGYQQQAKGGSFGLGQPNTNNYNPTAMGTTTVAVGIISTPIEFNMNETTIQSRPSALRLPYDEIITQTDPQFTFSVDQLSMWNIALAMSMEQDAVSGSSILELDMKHLRNATEVTGAGGNAIANSGFFCAELYTGAPPDTEAAAAGVSSWQLWKTKVFSNGPMTFGGGTPTQIPLRVQVFGNDNDKAGQIKNSIAHTKLAYEG